MGNVAGAHLVGFVALAQGRPTSGPSVCHFTSSSPLLFSTFVSVLASSYHSFSLLFPFTFIFHPYFLPLTFTLTYLLLFFCYPHFSLLTLTSYIYP